MPKGSPVGDVRYQARNRGEAYITKAHPLILKLRTCQQGVHAREQVQRQEQFVYMQRFNQAGILRIVGGRRSNSQTWKIIKLE